MVGFTIVLPPYVSMPYRLALESKPLDLEVFDSKVYNPNLKVWIPINIP